MNGYTPPRSSLEQAVARVMGEVLGIDRVGTGTDLFAVGGDDAAAARVAERLGDGLGTGPLPAGVVAAERTVERIARRLAADERLEAVAGVWMFADGMSGAEREARLRNGGCGHAPRVR